MWSNAGWGGDGGWYLNKAAAGGATTTWNPADKNAGVTLSNGNLTAATSTTSIAVRAIASHSTGKFFDSTHLDVLANVNGTIGMANSSASLSNFIGSDANGLAYNPNNGGILVGGSNIAVIQTAVQGDTIDMAVDIGGQLVWFRTTGGNWNNDPTANPATGVNGISYAASGLGAGPYFPAWAGFSSLDVVTANFGASAYSFAAPSGFSNW